MKYLHHLVWDYRESSDKTKEFINYLLKQDYPNNLLKLYIAISVTEMV